MLTFVDRMKDLIISGGLNISAAEVERVVCEFPGVVEALVIAAPDREVRRDAVRGGSMARAKSMSPR